MANRDSNWVELVKLKLRSQARFARFVGFVEFARLARLARLVISDVYFVDYAYTHQNDTFEIVIMTIVKNRNYNKSWFDSCFVWWFQINLFIEYMI